MKHYSRLYRDEDGYADVGERDECPGGCGADEPSKCSCVQCQGCGTMKGELTYQPEWKALFCPVCLADCVEELALEALQDQEPPTCWQCGSERKTVVSDRLYVNPVAVCCSEVA